MSDHQSSLNEKQQNKSEIKSIIDELLLENQELLCQTMMQNKNRKNKNLIQPKLSILIHRLQKNLIRISKISHPQFLAQKQHVKQQKQRFMAYLSKKNGVKK